METEAKLRGKGRQALGQGRPAHPSSPGAPCKRRRLPSRVPLPSVPINRQSRFIPLHEPVRSWRGHVRVVRAENGRVHSRGHEHGRRRSTGQQRRSSVIFNCHELLFYINELG